MILFKSKTIKDSNAFFDEFITKIKDLKVNDLVKIKNNPNLDNVLGTVFKYLESHQITLGNLVLELQEEFF